MGAQPNLTTQLVKHPNRTRKVKQRDPAAPRVQPVPVRCWWASFALLGLGIVFAVLWSNDTARFDGPVADVVFIGWLADALCLMIISVVVAVMVGEERRLHPMSAERDESRARRVHPVALRCWWASLVLTAFGVLAPVAWSDPGPPYDDSIGEIVWFLWLVGGWCLLLFSAVVAGDAR